MPEDDAVARKICAHLGRQPVVTSHVAFRLGQARTRAMFRMAQPRPAWEPVLTWISAHVRVRAGMAFVVLAFAFVAWQNYSPEPDFADLDAELLSGDLPPVAYLDPGFARIVSTAVNE